MSKVDVSQAICQAIDIIVDKKLANAGFNRAVQARISKIVDILKGHYKIEYQSNETDAYDFDHQRVYAVNDSVMVLIPNNDWDEQKIILGAIKNSNSDNQSEAQGYNLIGQNIILNDLDIRGLSSYKRDGDSFTIPFSGNEAISGAEEINQKIKRYVKQSANGLVLSSYIRTDFANDRFTDTLGIYGVNYILKFSKKDENNNIVYYYKTYTLDTRDVIGNPYLQNKTVLVTHTVKDFDPTDFEGIQSITGFVKGFPADDNKEQVYDVFISNIGICAAQVLSKDQNQNYNLWMTYPNGNQLTDNITSIILKANLKKDGKNFTEGVKYRWYRQNSNIRLGDSGYDSQAGAGWQCLNKINEQNVFIDYKDNDFIVTTETVGEDQIGIQVLSNITKIKCIAFYLGQKYEASTSIYYTTGININLISSDKTIGNVNQQVYYNADKDITFTCIVENQHQTQQTQYSFLWEIAAAGYENQTSSGTSISRTQNQFTFSDIRGISKASIICTVSYSNGTFIGTVSQDLQNRKGINGEYTVNILNGNRTFQFYEDGTLAVGGDGVSFNPLQLEIFNPSGNIIPQTLASSDEAGVLEILWKVPRSNCIITPIGMTDIQQDALIPDPAGSEDDFYHFKDVYSLTYTVAPYSSANINNIIQVYIAYRQSTGDADIKILKGSTSFASIRAGDPGTNGTDTASTIVGHITQSDTEVVSKRYYAHVYTDLNQNTSSLIQKYTDNNLTFNDFKFKLIQNGIDLDINTSSNALQWQLPIQKKLNFKSYFTNSNNFDLTNDSSISIPTNAISIQQNLNISNILRAIYNINDLVYYANMPICYVYAPSNYRFILNPTSGYTYVMYTNQGNFPKYDNNNQFVIQVYQHNPGQDWKLKTDNLSYSWSIYNNDENIQIVADNANGLQLISQNDNTAIIEPQANFQTNNLTPAIICQVKQNNNIIGVLYYPIYMMYNQYGFKYLNDWDGNSIDLQADGNSTILAPQIGAGKKEDNHSFSGILLGEVQTPGSQQSSQVGLFGYDNGQNSFFLNAKDGSATIGKSGAGQIKINTRGSDGSEKNQAIIQSGDYPIDQNNQPAGMKIKFSSTGSGTEQGPYIKFGTGKFEVDHDGAIKATEGTIAGWEIDDNEIYKTEENNNSKVFMNSSLSLNPVPSSYSSYAGQPMFLRAGGINDNEINFFVTHNGHLYAKDTYIEGNGKFIGNITANNGKIGSWIIEDPDSGGIEAGTLHTANIIMGNFTRFTGSQVASRFGGSSYGNSTNAQWYITAGQARSTLSSINFAIDKKGYLYADGAYVKGTIQATAGYIGTKAAGWQIDGNEIRTSDSLIYINANKNNRTTTLFTNEHPFLRVGETINSGVHFMVTHQGSLFANRAKITGTITAEEGAIGGWSIGKNTLSAYNGAVVLKAGTTGTTKMIEVTNSGSTVFSVNGNGALTATKGTIGGWKINSDSLSTYDDKVILRKGTATTSKVIEVINNGKTVFSVTGAGKLTATNAIIKGDITAKSLTIDKDAEITGTISASHIKGGVLNANDVTITNLDVTGKIGTNSLNVKKLQVTSGNTTNNVAWRTITYVYEISWDAIEKRFKKFQRSITLLASTKEGESTGTYIGPVIN